MRCYVVECCDRVITASRAVEIATNALVSEYRFVDPERLAINVINVKYEGCVWNVRLQVILSIDSTRMTMSTHLVQVDACTGQVVGHVLEDHVLL